MDTTLSKPHPFSDRLAWGITLVAVALLFDLIQSVYTFASLGEVINVDNIAQQQFNPLLTVLGCLAPVSGILKLIGVILIFMDSKRLGGQHRTLVSIGLGVYILSLVAFIAALPLSLMGTMNGSLSSITTGVWLEVATSILTLLALLLLVYAIVPGFTRILLIAAMVITLVGNIYTSAVTASGYTLQEFETAGGTFYIPNLNIDRTEGLFPVMVGLGTLAALIFLGVYAYQAVTAWKTLSNELPESVA